MTENAEPEDDNTHEDDEARDEVADAIRARQSLEGEMDTESLIGPNFTTGERTVAAGDLPTSDEALDDDDVEQTGNQG